MRRVRVLLLLSLFGGSTSACQTIEEVAGACIAVPVLAICGAGFVAGACSRCVGGPAPGALVPDAERGVEVPVAVGSGVMAMGY